MPEYLLILFLLLVTGFILHRRFQIKIFKSKSHLFIFYAIGLVFGITWDNIAIPRHHWSFGNDIMSGLHIGVMPIEEYAFILILPYFILVIFKIIEKYSKG